MPDDVPSSREIDSEGQTHPELDATLPLATSHVQDDTDATTPPPTCSIAVRDGFSLPEPAAPGKRPNADPLIDSELGGVTIVRMIAEGGMGRVYEGRQQKPRRPVAVKVIKPGLISPELLKRFDYEAQVLGRLRHPGIAQIYTVGTHDVSGQTVPFFVMEYIPNAKPLTQFANDRTLSSHERLVLFAKVCEAVAHGHQKGVIHRDLKPGNVLVDSAGQPKVIDFGVARSTDSDLAMTTMQTDVGALVGTLQYMSPEQFDADPNDLDVRLDVYALGVILYELLTGQPPYKVKQRAIYEVARIVREEEPTPITSLDKTLRRDVAIIAATCLQKDRSRRYSSATELGGDVQRFLAGEPITAVPPTLWDGITRLARRHKAAAVAVAAMAASLMAAVIGISAFALRAERAREQAELASAAESEQRTFAEQQQAAAEEAARRANRQLYMSALYKLDMALDSPTQRSLAVKTWHEARQAYAAAQADAAAEPVELAILQPLLDESIVVLEGHENSVTSLAFSSDGTRFATASDDHTARLWNAVTGEPLCAFEGHHGPIVSVAFSPDGSRLVTASSDTTARLWDARTGASLAVLDGHAKEVLSVAFHPDGSRIATASRDHTARLWNAATGQEIATLDGHDGEVLSVVFSPDGARLATASSDTTTRLWDTASGQPLDALEGHTDEVVAVAFSPDGRRLATASHDKTARLWDAVNCRPLRLLEGHEAQINSIAFSPDGLRLATASYDDTARLWDAADGRSLAILEHDAPVESIAFSPDGTQLATSSRDNTARLWDAATGERRSILEGHENYVAAVAFSPDGSRLATTSWDTTARLWDAAAGDALTVLAGHANMVASVAFSPDGARLATASLDNTARLWDATTGEPLAVLDGHEKYVVSVAFSPDGGWLATASLDNTARLWDAMTGRPQAVLRGHGNPVASVAFSPDGRRLATASYDTTVRLWDVETGEQRGVLEGHEDVVESVAFSPDGAWLATSSLDNTARLWDATTGELLRVFNGHDMPVAFVAFSPDGTRLATASWDSTARLWNAADGETSMVLRGHEDYVVSVTFSPDGTRLATASRDNTARLWDAATGETLAVLDGHGDHVVSVAFDPEGTRLATGSRDTTARLWGLSSATITRHRAAAVAARGRVAPEVAQWCGEGLEAAKAALASAKARLASDDWQQAANLLLVESVRAADQARQVRRLAQQRARAAMAMAQEGHPSRAVEQIDGWLADMSDPQAVAAFRSLRRTLAIQAGGPLAQQAFLDSVAEAHDRASTLNDIAWRVEEAAEAGREVSADLLAAAVAAARRAVELEPDNSNSLDTLAHLLARHDSLAEAVDVQRAALAHADDTTREKKQAYLTLLETVHHIRTGDLIRIEPEQATAHLGAWCRVRLQPAGGRWESADGPCVLDAGNPAALSIVLSVSGLARLGASDVFDPALAFRDQTLDVAGLVRLGESGPQIEVVVPDQISVESGVTAAGKPDAAAAEDGSFPCPLDGAWKMVVPEGQQSVKLIADGRFVWFMADGPDLVRLASGRCSLEGDRYHETIPATAAAADAWMAGATGRFRTRLVGDRWYHVGTLETDSGELGVNEVWERISPASPEALPARPEARSAGPEARADAEPSAE